MDPYTGASSYRGGNGTGATPQNGFSGDPWGGEYFPKIRCCTVNLAELSIHCVGGTSSSARQRVATSSLLPHVSLLELNRTSFARR